MVTGQFEGSGERSGCELKWVVKVRGQSTPCIIPI